MLPKTAAQAFRRKIKKLWKSRLHCPGTADLAEAARADVALM
jgi:hypothetical protein